MRWATVNTKGTNRRRVFRHTPVIKRAFIATLFISKPKKTLLDNHRHPAWYHLSNMRWSQRVRCQGVCASRTPMKKGVRTLSQPYRSPLRQLMRRKAHTGFHQRRSPPTRGGGGCSRTSDAMGPADEQGANVERRLLAKLMNHCVLSNPQPASGAETGKSHDTLPPPRWTATRGSRAERRSWTMIVYVRVCTE